MNGLSQAEQRGRLAHEIGHSFIWEYFSGQSEKVREAAIVYEEYIAGMFEIQEEGKSEQKYEGHINSFKQKLNIQYGKDIYIKVINILKLF